MPMEPLQRSSHGCSRSRSQALQWQKAGFDADLGLDKHFYDMAQAAASRCRAWRRSEFQISQFNEMSMPLQDRMLAETLKELDTTQTERHHLGRRWKAGDVAGVERSCSQDLKSEPEMYQRLLVERNRTWLPQDRGAVLPAEAGLRRRRRRAPGRPRWPAADAARQRLHDRAVLSAPGGLPPRSRDFISDLAIRIYLDCRKRKSKSEIENPGLVARLRYRAGPDRCTSRARQGY